MFDKQTLEFFTIRDELVKLDINLALQDMIGEPSAQSVVDGAYSKVQFRPAKKSSGLLVRVDASHLGYINKNFRFYRGKAANRSKRTWVAPRNKPVLKFHNVSSGEPIGTVATAEIEQFGDFTDWSENPRSNKPQGVLRLYVRINDEDAAQKFLDGRYNGVSITAVPTGGVFCSITGKNLMTMGSEERWEHIMRYRPGSIHTIKNEATGKEEKRLCYWAYDTLDYLELSVVNAPADDHAKVTGVEAPSGDRLEFDTESDLAKSVYKQEEKTKPFFISGLEIADSLTEEGHSQESDTMKPDLKELLERKDVLDHIDQVAQHRVTEAVAPLNVKIEELTQQLAGKTVQEEHLQNQVKTLSVAVETAQVELRKQLVTDIINTRLLLGKPEITDTEESRKAMAEELSERSLESLQDTHRDLYREMTLVKPLPISAELPVDAGQGDNANTPVETQKSTTAGSPQNAVSTTSIANRFLVNSKV